MNSIKSADANKPNANIQILQPPKKTYGPASNVLKAQLQCHTAFIAIREFKTFLFSGDGDISVLRLSTDCAGCSNRHSRLLEKDGRCEFVHRIQIRGMISS
jgi:hypothetical protein